MNKWDISQVEDKCYQSTKIMVLNRTNHFLMIEKMFSTFGFMSLAPAHPELHLVTYNCTDCTSLSPSVTQDVLGPKTWIQRLKPFFWWLKEWFKPLDSFHWHQYTLSYTWWQRSTVSAVICDQVQLRIYWCQLHESKGCNHF